MRDEVCPKCCSLDVVVWSFNNNIVDYECSQCHHKWTTARESSNEIVFTCHQLTNHGECRRKKFDASCLEEFLRQFRDYKDLEIEVWPYVPRHPVKGERDFGLIVESGHVKYEKGLSGALFILDDRFLRRWVRSPRSFIFDISPVEIFEYFARGLSRYLTEKGCRAVAKEIQQLDRTPKGAMEDADLEMVSRIIREYC